MQLQAMAALWMAELLIRFCISPAWPVLPTMAALLIRFCILAPKR